MAKLFNMTAFSGSIGEIVGCKGPFGFYIRRKPRKSKKQPTQRQLEWREKMAMAAGFLAPLKEIVYLGFATSYGSHTKTIAMNRAVSMLIQHALEGEYPNFYINPAAVVLSRGALSRLRDLQVGFINRKLRIQWSALLPTFNGFADDRVYILAYNTTERTVVVEMIERRAGVMEVDLRTESAGSELLVYVCVSTYDGKKFSNSQYLGRFEV